MNEIYQTLLARMDRLRELYRKQGPRVYVGSYGLAMDGSRLSLPSHSGVEPSEEWIIGLMVDDRTLVAYESFLLGALEEDPDLQEFKQSFSELQMKLEDPRPALIYVETYEEAQPVIEIPEYLLEAAGIRDRVHVMGCMAGFKIAAVE